MVQWFFIASNIKTSYGFYLIRFWHLRFKNYLQHSHGHFSLNFKVIIPITICLVFCLKNKEFVVTAQRFCTKGSCWIKPCESLIFLVHFILFAMCVTFLLVKILLSTVLKSANFIASVFWTDLIIFRTMRP